MSSLHLIRFCYLAAATIGLIFHPDGFTCFTLEPPAQPAPGRDGASMLLPELAYMMDIEIANQRRQPVVLQHGESCFNSIPFTEARKPGLLRGSIGVGMGVNILTGELEDTATAMQSLTELVRAQIQASAEPAWIVIRHLDSLDQLRERVI